MHATYDSEADAAYVYLTDEQLEPGRTTVAVDVPDDVRAMVILDVKNGKIVGLEVVGARAALHDDLLAAAVQLS